MGHTVLMMCVIQVKLQTFLLLGNLPVTVFVVLLQRYQQWRLVAFAKLAVLKEELFFLREKINKMIYYYILRNFLMI